MVEPAFALVVQGAKRVVLGQHVLQYQAGEFLIFTVDLPLMANIIQASQQQPFIGLGITLKPGLISDLLLESERYDEADNSGLGIMVGHATDDILEPVVRLLKLPEDAEDIPILLPAIEREIHWRLIKGPCGHLVRQIGIADSHIMKIGQAIRWLRSNYRESFLVETLARMVGMSVTSFHRHFLEITSYAPLQFQKEIRLQEARSQLLQGREILDKSEAKRS